MPGALNFHATSVVPTAIRWPCCGPPLRNAVQISWQLTGGVHTVGESNTISWPTWYGPGNAGDTVTGAAVSVVAAFAAGTARTASTAATVVTLLNTTSIEDTPLRIGNQ